jgi:hypothetical protein
LLLNTLLSTGEVTPGRTCATCASSVLAPSKKVLSVLLAFCAVNLRSSSNYFILFLTHNKSRHNNSNFTVVNAMLRVAMDRIRGKTVIFSVKLRARSRTGGLVGRVIVSAYSKLTEMQRNTL